MKAIFVKYSRRAISRLSPAATPTATTFAALLLAGASLGAMPAVKTLSGGPAAGYLDGDSATTAKFNHPMGLALDRSGNFLYVADRDNQAVREMDLSGHSTFTFATLGIDTPVGVALDGAGDVYVLNHSDGVHGSVVQFDSFGDLIGTVASGLANANGIALDAGTNVYLTVQGNTVLGISPSGVVSTIATIPAAGTLLQGITVMDNGLLAVCDAGRHGILLINPATGFVTNLTGFNGAGDHFGPKAFAKFNQPLGISAAGGGMLVVSDYGNNRVKVVDALGTVTNLYGVASSFWVTGPGTYPGWWDGSVCQGDINFNAYGCVEARLPAGVFFAADGTVFSTEDYYHLIRMVSATGLPLHPPPPPPVPAPDLGWVDFTIPPAVVVAFLRTNQPFVLNNDVIIAIQGTPGSETHFTFGPTPVGIDNIPDPTGSTGSTPPNYFDGMLPEQVPPSIVPAQPDLTIKAIGVQSGRQSSLVVSARFQFKAANPLVTGNNAALFKVSDQTLGAEMWYTIDGSDPTNGPPSLGPIKDGAALSLNANTNFPFRIRAFRAKYLSSDIVSTTFYTNAFVPNSMTFGFSSGEASSDFVASPGQYFYAPVTLSLAEGTKIFSLQFNVTATNAGPNPGPALAPGVFGFESSLEKPIPGTSPVVYERIPPLMFSAYAANPPPANTIVKYDNKPFVSMVFTDTANNLLGVGWLERATHTNLFDTTTQDLIKFSQPHDTLFEEKDGRVVLGGYAFQVPLNASAGQTYQIKIGRPSATSDGIGAPGSAVYVSTPTNGSLGSGMMNSIKNVTVGQLKYLAGDAAPFRWFNAGDFGDSNLDNSDVMQAFQSAVYSNDNPPPGSDFFDSMDSCGGIYADLGHGYLELDTLLSGPDAVNALFDGNDSTINQIAFGDGVLDVCDVYVTFRRSLDPSLRWFRRFWTNGVRGAEIVGNYPPQNGNVALSPIRSKVHFASADVRASAGQTVQIPITAQTFGAYPIRVLMLNLSVNPLDGSPALTTPVQFTPNPALGSPTLGTSVGNGNYAATWLNRNVTGLSSNAVLGTLTFQVPASALSSAAYAISFDHASASPNGLASFKKTALTGLVTLADRSASSYNDGIPDSWRLRYFGTVDNLLSQADADADGDGATNWEEYVAGTDPTDAKSCLTVSSQPAAAQSTLNSVIRWPSVAGKSYFIERSTSLFAPNWIPVSTNIGSGTDMEYQDATGGNVRFYRVRVAP
jgi:hypothetical protein